MQISCWRHIAICLALVSSFALTGESAVELKWVGKENVVNHHLDVPYHILEKKWDFGAETNSGNMIIHGDNLLALKSLLPKYEGKVKCIYIDPPYNTGNEGWCYNDNVNDPRIKKWLGEVVGKEGEDFTRHDKWLCMMYPRLKLLQKLLAKDGCIAISIGWQEVNNLVLMCKEIFATWQIVPITVQTSGGKPSGGFNYVHEYVVYIVPKNFSPNPSASAQKEYASPYHGMNLATFNQTQRPNQVYPIFIDDKGKLVDVGKSLQARVKDGEYHGELSDFVYDYDEAPAGAVAVWPVTKKGVPCVWRLNPKSFRADYESGFIKIQKQKPGKTKNLYAVQYLSEGIKKKIKSGELESYRPNDDIPTLEVRNFKTGGVSVGTMWNDKSYYTAQGGGQMSDILGSKGAFTYPKPVGLVEEIIARVVDKDSIVLDSFAGSGTTAHAVLRLNAEDGGNRKFILVELGDYAEKVTAERVKRVIEGYGEGEKAVEGTGGSFSFCELGEPLMQDELLNPKAGMDAIREFVWYSETKTAMVAGAGKESYLGTNNGTAYYFFYEPDNVTELNRTTVRKVKAEADDYVVYADVCTLSAAELERRHITFKKIPRDIATK